MARPTKKGLDYFPLDVSFENSSVEDIECMYGMLGVAIIITMWQYIYRTNGYYCDYSEKIALRLSKRFGNQLHAINSEKMAYDVFDEVIKKAIEYDAFDADIYKKYGVLTSKGIQERYLEATKKRKNVEVISDYLLLNDEAKTVNVYINGVNDGINSKKVDVNTQSKVKESKLNKSKLNKSKLNKSKLNKSKLNKSEVNKGLEASPSHTNKKIFGEFKNVLLSDEDIVKLKNKFYDYEARIENLSAYMESKCVTYENCYATICKWALNDRDKTPAKSKFNNYEDTNKMDYAAIEEKLLDMQLGM